MYISSNKSLIDRTGLRYGMLTAIKYVGNSRWECLCDCGNSTVVKGSALTIGKTTSCGCKRKKYHLDSHYFDVIDTEAKAYTLGLIATDGNVSKNYANVKIDLQESDIDVLEKILDAMQYDYNIRHYEMRYKHSDGSPLISRMARVNMTNKELVKTIVSYGITPAKSNTLSIDWSRIPKELTRHFLRGMWDGNGSISISYSHGHMDITTNFTSSTITIQKVNEILHDAIPDITTYIYQRHVENPLCSTLIVGNKKNNYDLLNYLYGGSTDRKSVV